MEDNLLQHFAADERPFIARAEDWLRRVREKKRQVVTDFLDPRQVQILHGLAARDGGVRMLAWGGYDGAERQRVQLYPDFFRDEPSPWEPLTLLQGRLSGGEELSHRDFLGSLLALGIKREKVGDLWPLPSGCQAVVAAEIADYLLLTWNQVGRFSFHVEKAPWEKLVAAEPQWEEHLITVSSPRLDAFLAESYRLSRAEAVQLIRSQRVRVNWRLTDRPETLLSPGDNLSVKGFGRLRVLAELGTNKKGKFRFKVGKVR